MPKTFHRTDRVSAQLRRELGTLVHNAVREHGLPSVSVSDVEITRDMAHAKVFVTALMPERSAEAVAGLKELGYRLRMDLARAMKLRHVPELHSTTTTRSTVVSTSTTSCATCPIRWPRRSVARATKNNRATPGMPGVVAFRLRDV